MRLGPTPRMLYWLAGWSMLGFLPPFWPDFLIGWLLPGGVLLLVALQDAFTLFRRPLLEAERSVPPALPLGRWRSVGLRFTNHHHQPATITVFDHYPTTAADCADLPQRVTIAPAGWIELRYRLRPVMRGQWVFAPVQVRLESFYGLWWRDDRLGPTTTVRIYPDFSIIARYIRLTADSREAMMGIHRRRRRGEGQTFLQLREYRIGDSLRQIDWKATARMRKPIARDYQDERHQTVLFLLDCSRRLRAQDDDLSHFDHALNAMILLAYVALRQGDAVGVQSFGGERRWLAPRSGPGMLTRLINTVYDLQPSLEPPDYSQAAHQLLSQQRKRALVVLLTNLRDEDQAELRPAVALLSRRHLVLIANLRESVLDELLAQPIHDLDQAHLYATCCHYQLQRDRVQEDLRQHGGMVLDSSPQRLPAAMVNQYLDLKRGGRL